MDGLHDRLSVRREDVFISLVRTAHEDWSFGNGEASLVKAGRYEITRLRISSRDL